ncbi:MAG: acyl carrier protein [Trebonia sp.]
MSIDDFVSLIQDELGIAVTAADVDRGFDELPGWDSMYLLWLATSLERTTGQAMSLPDLLEADSLQQVYALTLPPDAD